LNRPGVSGGSIYLCVPKIPSKAVSSKVAVPAARR
jgi:hypothetical protein